MALADVLVQVPSTVRPVALLTATGFGMLHWIPCIQSADGGRDREHAAACGRFCGPGREVVFINFAHIPLVGTQSWDHIWVQRRLGNVVKLGVRR